MLFNCTDGNALVEIEADSAQEAAQEYVEGGEWGSDHKTFWVSVYCTQVKDGEEMDESIKVKIAVEPEDPDCEEDECHEWEQILVRGHGGGVIVKEQCSHCKKLKITDTWAQDCSDGEQGLESVEYREAEED